MTQSRFESGTARSLTTDPRRFPGHWQRCKNQTIFTRSRRPALFLLHCRAVSLEVTAGSLALLETIEARWSIFANPAKFGCRHRPQRRHLQRDRRRWPRLCRFCLTTWRCRSRDAAGCRCGRTFWNPYATLSTPRRSGNSGNRRVLLGQITKSSRRLPLRPLTRPRGQYDLTTSYGQHRGNSKRVSRQHACNVLLKAASSA